ncbi:MAG: class II aldolase/adducin family protein [Candidatus Cloacimonetes bacterium]|nr:class II aldolase/adducin family protein [Candidatus Cloacimonadota bacterium]
MQYQGIKFQVDLTAASIPSDHRVDELRKWCHIFHEKGLTPPYPGGSYGNLSFRIKTGQGSFLITGSSIGLKEDLTEDDFVLVKQCDLEKKIIKAVGLRDPSSESMLHHAIYQVRNDINAIFHGHCPEILHHADHFKIPQTSRLVPYGTLELVNSVLEVLDDHCFLVIKNHGFIAMGKNMQAAGDNAIYFHKKCAKE